MKRGDWALMEPFYIPNLDRPEELYLSRLRLVQTPWFSLYLHRFDGPDSRPTFHDHPWAFVSVILRGGYIEQRLDMHDHSSRRRRIRFVNVMRRDDAHYIEQLSRTPTWSLLFVGARRRTWGYWRPVPGSHRSAWSWTPFNLDVHQEEYDAARAA